MKRFIILSALMLSFCPAWVASAQPARAPAADADKVRQLEAENQMLRAQVKSLKVENEKLKKALAQPTTKPAEKAPKAITWHDLTPTGIKADNFVGADLAIDGFVADIRGEGAGFVALFLAGETTPDGDPVIVYVQKADGTVSGFSLGRRSTGNAGSPRGMGASSAAGLQSLQSGSAKKNKTARGKPNVLYQIQIQLSGPMVANLKATDTIRKVRGFIQKIEAKEGGFVNRIGNKGVPNPFKTGTIITVTLGQATIK